MDSSSCRAGLPGAACRAGSHASLDLYSKYPEYFIPTTADGSSPHWFRDTLEFAAQLKRDLDTGQYFLMGEFELPHYPSPGEIVRMAWVATPK